MEEFKKYYKFPLKMWEDFSIKVFTDDNKMAFDWLLPNGKKCNEYKQKVLNKINSLESDIPKEDAYYYHDEGRIIVKTQNKDLEIILIRGWGMLTGVGGYNLPADKAAEIQNAFAEYCVEMLNKK